MRLDSNVTTEKERSQDVVIKSYKNEKRIGKGKEERKIKKKGRTCIVRSVAEPSQDTEVIGTTSTRTTTQTGDLI